MGENTEKANEYYGNFLKKLKYKFGEEYICKGIIKDFFGKNVEVSRFCFKLLNDNFDMSPLLVVSFYENGEMYFAESNFILDKYDKSGIIEEMREKRFYDCYNIKLLKSFLEEIKEKKGE